MMQYLWSKTFMQNIISIKNKNAWYMCSTRLNTSCIMRFCKYFVNNQINEVTVKENNNKSFYNRAWTWHFISCSDCLNKNKSTVTSKEHNVYAEKIVNTVGYIWTSGLCNVDQRCIDIDLATQCFCRSLFKTY